jgi:hypothetical protein
LLDRRFSGFGGYGGFGYSTFNQFGGKLSGWFGRRY